MRLVRTFISVTALAILTCVIAIACLVIFIDPNKMKPTIIEEVKAKTGYQMAMEGNLSWSFYPILGVKIERITLSESKQSTPFIDLHNITVATEVSQLLHGIQKLQGHIHISDVKLMKVHATNATVGLHWQDKVLTLKPIEASLYDGTLEGAAYGHQLSEVPNWNWDVQFNHIQVKPLLQDVNGGESRIGVSGTADMRMQMVTQGKTHDQMVTDLNGTTKFSISKGNVEGVDLNYFVKTADALLNKKEVAAPADMNQTAFDSLTGTVNVKNGIAETSDLLLVSPAFTTKGNGTFNLIYHAINFQLQVKPQESAQTQWEVPVLITGNVTRPDVRLDMLEIQKFVATQELQKVKTKVSEQIKKHVPGKTGELLQNLLGK